MPKYSTDGHFNDLLIKMNLHFSEEFIAIYS